MAEIRRELVVVEFADFLEVRPGNKYAGTCRNEDESRRVCGQFSNGDLKAAHEVVVEHNNRPTRLVKRERDAPWEDPALSDFDWKRFRNHPHSKIRIPVFGLRQRYHSPPSLPHRVADARSIAFSMNL